LKALHFELATLRNQKRQADLESAQLREEAKNLLEFERRKRMDDEERLRAEMALLVTQVRSSEYIYVYLDELMLIIISVY
jgi:hypothetical protein